MSLRGFSSFYFFRDLCDGDDFFVYFNHLHVVKEDEERGYIVFFPSTKIEYETDNKSLDILVPFIKRESSIFFHPNIDFNRYDIPFEDISFLDSLKHEMVYIMPISIVDITTRDIGSELVAVEINSNHEEILIHKSISELNFLLDEAVTNEDYERASKIRDEIAKR